MILNLNEYKKAEGTVVVIDVLRAFTTSSIILNNGRNYIYLVRDEEYALRTKNMFPQHVTLVGEKGGKFIKGFDHFNSPADMMNLKWGEEEDVILRTSSGTRGALAVSKLPAVDDIVAGSFTTALALKKYLKDKEKITYLITGSRTPDGGLEDKALALYLMGEWDIGDCREAIHGCYAAKNWIDNALDLEIASSTPFNFVQKISKAPTEDDRFLLMFRKDM